MITSNEPGLYLAGRYGVRIENCVLTVDDSTTDDFGGFMRFEDLTLFPYDIKLMDMDQLTTQEKAQINAYHAEVRRRLNKYLKDEERAWLEAKTKEI